MPIENISQRIEPAPTPFTDRVAIMGSSDEIQAKGGQDKRHLPAISQGNTRQDRLRSSDVNNMSSKRV